MSRNIRLRAHFLKLVYALFLSFFAYCLYQRVNYEKKLDLWWEFTVAMRKEKNKETKNLVSKLSYYLLFSNHLKVRRNWSSFRE